MLSGLFVKHTSKHFVQKRHKTRQKDGQNAPRGENVELDGRPSFTF